MLGSRMRRVAVLACGGLVAGLLSTAGIVATPAPAGAATDPGCTTLGGLDGSGTCVVSAPIVVGSTPVIVLENLHFTPGAHVTFSTADFTLTVGDVAHPSDFEMDVDSSIDGGGKNITVSVPFGNMTMHGTPGSDQCGYPTHPAPATGAQITSVPGNLATTININVGNFGIPPTGDFTMERCSLVDVSNLPAGGTKSSVGTINITVGRATDIDGLVLSESNLGGVGGTQPPGGGPISIKSGCELRISSTGVVSSKGQDPGADLVHLEGCDVLIDGLVQSTGVGHAVPNSPANHCATGVHAGKPPFSTGCVEVIGGIITISNTGEISADLTNGSGSNGTSWIDLFANDDISITGRTGTGAFAVHALNNAGNTDVTPSTITAIAVNGTFTGSGNLMLASAPLAGSNGGTVDIEAGQSVNMDSSAVVAVGDFDATGGLGDGGHLTVNSFNSFISWQNGNGDVRPTAGASPGTIGLAACSTVNTTGTTFNGTTPTVNATTYTDFLGVAHVLNNQLCGGTPSVPSYVTGAFTIGVPIWAACEEGGPGTKSGMKFNDLNGNGANDAGEPGIKDWPINLYGGPGFATLVASTTTDVNGNYAFTISNPGTYRVCEGTGPAGFAQTYPNVSTPSPNGQGETTTSECPAPNVWGWQFDSASDVDLTGNDFGNWVAPTKSGMKWEDKNGNGVKNDGDNGLQDWTIKLYDSNDVEVQSKTTAADGTYSFDPVGPGTYKVCEVLPSDWVQTFPNASTPAPANETIINTCPPPSGTGYGYQFTSQSGVDLPNNNFGNFKKITKSGMKWEDKNGNGVKDDGDNGLQDWTIKLYNSSNVEVQSKVTDVDGNYMFDPIGPGTYTVCEVLQSGWVQTFPKVGTPNPTNETIANNCVPPNGTGFGYRFTTQSGVNLANNDFGNFKKITKSGTKWNDVNGNGVRDAGDGGLPNWTIRLYNSSNVLIQSKTTDGSGNYSFDPVGPGTYRVCEVIQSGWVQRYPNATTASPRPNGELVINTCFPPSGTAFGYQFTAQSGTNLGYNDFGNFHPPGEAGTAFAKGANGTAKCFLDIPNLQNNRWGWSNGTLTPGTYTFTLWQGAGQCDTSKGTNVGTVTVTYIGAPTKTVTVTYNLTGGHRMSEAHVYVGTDILPKKNGKYTVAPGQYPQGATFNPTVTTATFTFTNVMGNIYVIAHAAVT